MPIGFCRTRFVIIIAAAVLAASCGGGAATGDVDKITVVQSQFDITVTNTAGKALFEIKAEILPVGPSSHFTTLIARMENGERRVIAHNVFTDRDGVPFSARSHKAKAVAVSAKDIDGKTIMMETPWKK
jgi:ABC-type glycerol-3-phosphate transport system substrate-binding protein